MFQVCPGRWAKPLMSRQAPKSRGKSGDAEKCHQVTCISLALARHCPSLPVPHFNSHWNSCHLYIRSIAYATQLTHVISHLSHFPSSRSHMISPRLTKPMSQLNSAVICLILFGLWWTDGLMDWWTCLFPFRPTECRWDGARLADLYDSLILSWATGDQGEGFNFGVRRSKRRQSNVTSWFQKEWPNVKGENARAI